MKKLFGIFLILSLTLFVFTCGGSGDSNDEKTAETLNNKEVQNPNAFSALETNTPSGAIPASAIPASAIPASMLESSGAESTGAIPASAIPASFASGSGVPALPPESSFLIDMNAFSSGGFFYFLKNPAKNFAIDLDINIPDFGDNFSSSDLIDQLGSITEPSGQASLVSRFIENAISKITEIPGRIYSKVVKKKPYYSENAVLMYHYKGYFLNRFFDKEKMEYDAYLLVMAAKKLEVTDPENEKNISKNVDGFIITLYVNLTSDSIKWENKTILNGIMNKEGTKGAWQIFDDESDDNTNKLRILWKAGEDKELNFVKFAINQDKDSGSSLEFKRDPTKVRGKFIEKFRFLDKDSGKKYLLVYDKSKSYKGVKINDDKMKCWQNTKTRTCLSNYEF